MSYFDPRKNKVQEGYDGSQKRQIDFSMVTVVKDYTTITDKATYDPRSNSKSIAIPTDVLTIVNERLVVTRDGVKGTDGKVIGGQTVNLTVVPLQFQEYDRLMSKPFARPVKRQAWRIFNASGTSNKSDLVVGPTDVINSYSLRYVKRPKPIVLTDLDGLTIEGVGTASKCELDPILHHEILKRAVELAKAAYDGTLQSTIAMGQASQTDIGHIQSK